MMQSYIDINRVHKLSKGDLGVPLYQKVIKLSEEAGEVAQAFLEYDGAKNVSKSASAEEKTLGVLEECCDVLNVTMDIINALTDGSPKLENEVVELFQKKLDKWESKQLKYTEPQIITPKVVDVTPKVVDVTPRVVDITPEIIMPNATSTELTTEDNIANYIGKAEFNEVVVNAPVKPKVITKPEIKPFEAPIKSKTVAQPTYDFPEILYHSSGTNLVPFTGEHIYRPSYTLKHNQRMYGVPGSWNVVVTYDGDTFITEHPQDHFNGQILTKEP